MPADVELCRKFAVNLPDRDLTQAEVETFWKTDRLYVAEERACLTRLLCAAHEVRRDIGAVANEPVCDDPNAAKTAPKVKKKMPVKAKPKAAKS